MTTLKEAVVLSKFKFQEYANNHLAKDPPDYAKASTNQAMADMCQKAIDDDNAFHNRPKEEVSHGPKLFTTEGT